MISKAFHPFRSLALVAVLAIAGPAAAQHTPDRIAEARQLFIAGDYAAALEILIPAAEAGDANAQNILGAAYDAGNGVPKDVDKALEWWEKSAAQDFDRALHNLGLHHKADDPALAAEYFERAAAQDYAPALNELGLMHRRGDLDGVPDSTRASEFYQQAVDLGHAHAMNNLGLLYVNGDGVPEDLEYAFYLFNEAADQGHAEALANLGVMYNFGYATRPDPLTAMAIYEMAAALGSARAAVNLAFDLIEQAPDPLRDLVRGWAWCLYGMENAQTDEAQDLAEDCDYLGKLLDADTKAAASDLTVVPIE